MDPEDSKSPLFCKDAVQAVVQLFVFVSTTSSVTVMVPFVTVRRTVADCPIGTVTEVDSLVLLDNVPEPATTDHVAVYPEGGVVVFMKNNELAH
jgi:hypothetical protein